MLQLRRATLDDLVAINDIYNFYVLHSTTTYQEVPDTLEDRRRWFVERSPRHPVTVADDDGMVVGWGSLNVFRARSAYRFSTENSVYVRDGLHRRGIGAALLDDQINQARSLNFRTIIAGIDADQAASIAIHSKFGFRECGRMNQVGYKFDRWLDVVFMQRTL